MSSTNDMPHFFFLEFQLMASAPNDNSLSLDQLKQKTNHISLKDFYIKVNKYINECLQDGWGRKDAINPEDYKI